MNENIELIMHVNYLLKFFINYLRTIGMDYMNSFLESYHQGL